jgi:dipeptidyl aminopeptidase/acylaminoacyl peptidase
LIGPWQASITLPPASGDPSPPEACLLPQDWPALQTASAPLDGRLLLEGPPPHGVYFPGLSLMDLASGQQKELSPGGWADLSPNGEQVAYINDMGLHVLQTNSGEDIVIVSDAYSPVWAPTGDRLAFVRSGQGVWLSNSLGAEMIPLPGTNTDTTGIVGWSPDGSQLAVFSITPLGSQIHQIDVETGAAQELFVIANRKAAFAQLSPDGQRIAYSAEVFGSLENGLYVSNLDGSQSNLIAQSGPDVLFTLGAWSPDGRWLLLNAHDPRQLTPAPQAPVIVNVETCQAAILPGVLGDVLNWSATP